MYNNPAKAMEMGYGRPSMKHIVCVVVAWMIIILSLISWIAMLERRISYMSTDLKSLETRVIELERGMKILEN